VALLGSGSVSSGWLGYENLKRDVCKKGLLGRRARGEERMPQLARNSCSIFYNPDRKQHIMLAGHFTDVPHNKSVEAC
jgi:hypothetical protein